MEESRAVGRPNVQIEDITSADQNFSNRVRFVQAEHVKAMGSNEIFPSHLNTSVTQHIIGKQEAHTTCDKNASHKSN